jgi:hypothetical protein
MPDEIQVGLRFERKDARRLREHAAHLRTLEAPGEFLSLFEKAADAAEHGEPMILVASSRLEIEQTAIGFTQFGVERPVVEELSGL